MSKDGTEPIIKTWKLRNFQSICETETLDLKPMTIFSGPNSSGKSAVIKSILMVAQTLDSSAREHPLVLSGKYTQLGDFDHVIHHGSDPSEMELGFVIKRPEREIKVEALIEKDPISTKDSTSFTSMRVKDSTISWGESDQRSVKLEFDPIDELQEIENQSAGEILHEEIDLGLFNYKITSSENIVFQPLSEAVVSGSLSNFLPERALIRVKPGIRKIAAQIEQVIEAIHATVDDRLPNRVNLEEKLSEGVLQFIGGVLPQVDAPDYIAILRNIEGRKDSLTIDALTKDIENWLYDFRDGFRDDRKGDPLMEDLARRLQRALRNLPRRSRQFDQKIDQKIELEAREVPHPYSTVIQQIRQVFGDQIFYLGPLRDDPRAIYGIPPLPNQRDVGLKGEYTAAMLDIHKGLVASYPEPPKLGKKFNGRYSHRSARLITAVQNGCSVWD